MGKHTKKPRNQTVLGALKIPKKEIDHPLLRLEPILHGFGEVFGGN